MSYSPPVTIVDQESLIATRYDNQRKFFANPRGFKHFYALIYYKDTANNIFSLRVYRSGDKGKTWVPETELHSWTSDKFDGASLCYYEDEANARLIVYFAYSDTDGNLFYSRGEIPDIAYSIVLIIEQQLFIGDANNKVIAPVITIDRLGYIWIVYDRLCLKTATRSETLPVDNFIETKTGWTRVGASPWLNAIEVVPTNYIETDVRDDEIGDFTFEYTPETGIISLVEVRLWCMQESGGNDQIEIYVWDGSVWSLAGTITPNPDGFTYSSVDVTAILDTWAKINNAKMYLIKKTVGAKQLVTVDYAEIRVTYTQDLLHHDVRCMASTVPYNPTATQWSSEYTVFSATVPELDGATSVYPTVASFLSGVTPQVLVGWKYLHTDKNYYATFKELSWDGTSFTLGVSQNVLTMTDAVLDPFIYSIIDTDNKAWIMWRSKIKYYNRLHYSYWVAGTGLGATPTTAIEVYTGQALDLFDGGSMTIDFSATPHRMYYFYSHQQDIRVTVQYHDVGEPLSYWGYYAYVPDNTERLKHFSASQHDIDSYMQVIYTTQTTAKVRFLEIPIRVVPPKIIGDGLTWIIS